MTTKPVIISSSGLKNIVLSKYQNEEDFVFVFGEEKIQMKNFFAEFISPIVSHIHQADPTISIVDFGEKLAANKEDFNKLSKSILTPDTISFLQQISSGSTIELNEEQSIKMRIISQILGNDELHQKLNELFPPTYNEENINSYLKNIECYYNFSLIHTEFDLSSLVTFIASHFYSIDQGEFLKLPRKIQYMIISNRELLIESEDWLFDIISQIIESQSDEFNNILFLEQIEFTGLSEVKFEEFIDAFDFNEITGQLWLNLCKRFFLNSTKKELHKKHSIIKKKMLERIVICGYDEFNQLGENPNNENDDNEPFIYPAIDFSHYNSSLLSYSVYNCHLVVVYDDGSVKGIGCNSDGEIGGSLSKQVIYQFMKFSLDDDKQGGYVPVSAVSLAYGTLYMVSEKNGNEKKLVLCDHQTNDGKPVFLNIGDVDPVALFGGRSNSAAIGSNGEVIFIKSSVISEKPESCINAISLPDEEKASSVACCEDLVVVLSMNGRVFMSSLDNCSEIEFSEVDELKGKECICVSGTSEHCFAVTKEGKVFVRGSNERGQIGLGENVEKVSSFTEIPFLSEYEIRAAYAGCNHSLFETKEGKLLSCGANYYGQLLLRCGPGDDVYLPTETTITSGAEFCIAGWGLTAVFIGTPPPNTPNMRIQL